MSQPVISLCHTTARLPDGWRAATQAWFDNCDHPEQVEHCLTADDSRIMADVLQNGAIFPNTKTGVNPGPKTAVAGWNFAAKLSTGKLIISLADDWFPCPHWDTELLKMIPDLDGEYVLDVDTCGNDHLLTFSLLTRAYLMKYSKGEGWLFYPEYTGMYADNDFTDSARLDKVIINARHLKFPHRHPNYFADVEPDAIHLWQGRPEAWRTGIKVYKKRCLSKGLTIRPIICVCLPGEVFRSTVVAHILDLNARLSQRFTVSPIFCYSSNPHTTRGMMAQQIVGSIPLPDYVLWIDDDNTLTIEQFEILFQDLNEIPVADMVAAWAFVQPDVVDAPHARTSVGLFDENGIGKRMSHSELMAGDADVQEIDYTGFPAVLMRGELLEKTGPNPFAPIVDSKFDHGFASEDLAFCIHARQNGARLFVDRRVRSPHLKLRDAVPRDFPATVGDERFLKQSRRRDEMAKELAAAGRI